MHTGPAREAVVRARTIADVAPFVARASASPFVEEVLVRLMTSEQGAAEFGRFDSTVRHPNEPNRQEPVGPVLRLRPGWGLDGDGDDPDEGSEPPA